VRISRDSYNQLKRFLTDKKQTVLLNILQEHLFLDCKFLLLVNKLHV
jgi:transcription initiation factor TFIID subunit 5